MKEIDERVHTENNEEYNPCEKERNNVNTSGAGTTVTLLEMDDLMIASKGVVIKSLKKFNIRK